MSQSQRKLDNQNNPFDTNFNKSNYNNGNDPPSKSNIPFNQYTSLWESSYDILNKKKHGSYNLLRKMKISNNPYEYHNKVKSILNNLPQQQPADDIEILNPFMQYEYYHPNSNNNLITNLSSNHNSFSNQNVNPIELADNQIINPQMNDNPMPPMDNDSPMDIENLSNMLDNMSSIHLSNPQQQDDNHSGKKIIFINFIL